MFSGAMVRRRMGDNAGGSASTSCGDARVTVEQVGRDAVHCHYSTDNNE